MMAQISGTDVGLERHRADRRGHHRGGAAPRRCRTVFRLAIMACSADLSCSSGCTPRPSAASSCRASRAAAGAAGRSRTARSAHRLGMPGRRAQRLDRGYRAQMPGAGRKPGAAAGFLRRRQVPRRARHRHASAQPGRGQVEFRANAGAASARPGGSREARPASRAAICCKLPGEKAVQADYGRQYPGPAQLAGDRAHRRRRRVGRSAGTGRRARRRGCRGGADFPTARRAKLYGVVLRGSMSLDESATQRLRDQLRSRRKARPAKRAKQQKRPSLSKGGSGVDPEMGVDAYRRDARRGADQRIVPAEMTAATSR